MPTDNRGETTPAQADAHLERAQAMLDNADPDTIAVANAKVDVADAAAAVERRRK
jgi:hypothetical protein